MDYARFVRLRRPVWADQEPTWADCKPGLIRAALRRMTMLARLRADGVACQVKR